MSRSITVGFDGSPQSRAAAHWAADEAVTRGVPLHAVYAWEEQPGRLALTDARTERARVLGTPGTAEAVLRAGHPGIAVRSELLTGPPVPTLLDAARGCDLLVVGSRAHGGVRGFLLGSVAQSLVSRGTCPVALVRRPEDVARADGAAPGEAAGQQDGATARQGGVVLGLGPGQEDDAPMAFAFEEAAYRSVRLRVVYASRSPVATTRISGAEARLGRQETARLSALLAPWRRRFPEVGVDLRCVTGDPGDALVRAAGGASLLVISRGTRTVPGGPRTCHTAHTVMHEAAMPVVVVP